MLPERMGIRRDPFSRLFPFFLLAITIAALIPVLEAGISEPIPSASYMHMSLSIQDRWASFLRLWIGWAHPVLYFIVLRIPALFGHSKLAWRSASIIPGMAGVYLLGLIAARLCKSKTVALLAAAAYGFSVTMKAIFIIIQSYSLAIFFVLAAFYCLIDALAGNVRRNRSLIWFGILTSLAIASEYYAILFLLACLLLLVLLLAAHPLFRERSMAWADRNWRVLITALGLPFATTACFYLTHMRSAFSNTLTPYLSDFRWTPGSSRIAFVLRNLRADLSYMLPIELPSAGAALGVLAVIAPFLLYRTLSRKQSHKSLASAIPVLLFLLLLAELVILSLLRLYPFGGEARQQSILFPFFTLTAFLLLDWIIGLLPTTRRLGWLPAGILGLAAAIAVNYFSARFASGASIKASAMVRPWGRAAQPARTTMGKAGIRWVKIPGGTFMMGADDLGPSAQPRHEVKIKTFEMAQTLVTNKQYRACVDAGVCTKVDWSGPWFENDYQPVLGVTWDQAKTFSRYVDGRLPTEAEWEYASRGGGREQKYPWGDEDVTCARAVLGDCPFDAYDAPAPVCSKPAGNTQQGLCDMAGNAWEWMQDSFHDSYIGAPKDGSAWEDTDIYRVGRGSSWNNGASATSARSACRAILGPGYEGTYIGFRPAR